MSEMEPREAGIDNLLRRSMAAPVPSLPPDFDQRFMRELRHAWPRARMGGHSGDDTWAARLDCGGTLGAARNPGNSAAECQVDLADRIRCGARSYDRRIVDDALYRAISAAGSVSWARAAALAGRFPSFGR